MTLHHAPPTRPIAVEIEPEPEPEPETFLVSEVSAEPPAIMPIAAIVTATEDADELRLGGRCITPDGEGVILEIWEDNGRTAADCIGRVLVQVDGQPVQTLYHPGAVMEIVPPQDYPHPATPAPARPAAANWRTFSPISAIRGRYATSKHWHGVKPRRRPPTVATARPEPRR